MKVGDKVSWTKVSKKGKVVELTTLTGKIESIDGDSATIIKDVGYNRVVTALSDLTPVGQKSELKQYIEDIIKSYNK